jgi:hypothetical protein
MLMEKSGPNTLIRLGSCYEAVHDDLVVLRLPYFPRIHFVVSPS